MPGRSRFTPEQKAEIVLRGIKEPKKVSEICREHGLAPVTFCRWKREYLSGGLDALSRGKRINVDDLIKENEKLKTTIGELFVELEMVKKKQGLGR